MCVCSPVWHETLFYSWLRSWLMGWLSVFNRSDRAKPLVRLPDVWGEHKKKCWLICFGIHIRWSRRINCWYVEKKKVKPALWWLGYYFHRQCCKCSYCSSFLDESCGCLPVVSWGTEASVTTVGLITVWWPVRGSKSWGLPERGLWPHWMNGKGENRSG